MKSWLRWALLGAASCVGVGIIAALITYAAVETPKVRATVTDDTTLPSLMIDDVKLHLKTVGDQSDPTVVFIHGGPGNDFRHFEPLTALADQYHLVFYDQRGAGLSERVESERVQLKSLVEELNAIGEHFSPDHPLRLVGHSWGAMLGSAYLEAHPDRVSHLALIEPGFLTQSAFEDFVEQTGGGLPSFSLALLGHMWTTAFEALRVEGPDEDATLDYFMYRMAFADVPDNPLAGYFCGGAPEPDSFNTFRMGVRSSLAIQSQGIDENRRLRQDFVGKRARAFERPVLILAGSCNTIIGEAHQRKHHLSLFSDAELQVIPHAGHMMIEEQSDDVLSRIAQYFSQ